MKDKDLRIINYLLEVLNRCLEVHRASGNLDFVRDTLKDIKKVEAEKQKLIDQKKAELEH